MTTASGAAVLAAFAFLLLAPRSSTASLAAKCQRSCHSAIVSCVTQGGRRRACRKLVLRQCRREGLQVCASTTTTTISPTPTSTTCPSAPFDARGTWVFSGNTLVTDPCSLAETSTAQYTVDVATQCGNSLAGTIDLGSGAAVTGLLTSADGLGFRLDGSLPCNPNTGYCATVQFTANGIIGNNASTADLQINSTSKGMACPEEWSGTAAR